MLTIGFDVLTDFPWEVVGSVKDLVRHGLVLVVLGSVTDLGRQCLVECPPGLPPRRPQSFSPKDTIPSRTLNHGGRRVVRIYINFFPL